jgi:hypothetical protein
LRGTIVDNKGLIIYCPHPFTNQDTTTSEIDSLQTLEEVRNALGIVGEVSYNLNGKHVTEGVVGPGDSLIVRSQPLGSGVTYNQSDVTRKVEGWAGAALIIGGLVLTIWVPWLGVFVAGLGMGLLAVALSTASANSSNTTSITRPDISGASNSSLSGKVPLILGKNRLTPAYAAAPFTDISRTDDGKYKYLYLLFVLGYAPLKVTDIKIGDTLLATNRGMGAGASGSVTVDGQYAGVSIELRQDGTLPQMFPMVVEEQAVSISLNRYTSSGVGLSVTFNADTHSITRNDGGNWGTDDYLVGDCIYISWARHEENNGEHIITGAEATVLTCYASTFVDESVTVTRQKYPSNILTTTNKRVRRLSFTIEFSNGLCTWIDGTMYPATVDVRAYYRLKGTRAWTQLPGWVNIVGTGEQVVVSPDTTSITTVVTPVWTPVVKTVSPSITSPFQVLSYVRTVIIDIDDAALCVDRYGTSLGGAAGSFGYAGVGYNDGGYGYFSENIRYTWVVGDLWHKFFVDDVEFDTMNHYDTIALRLPVGQHVIRMEYGASILGSWSGELSVVTANITYLQNGHPAVVETVITATKIARTTNKTIRFIADSPALPEGQYETCVIRRTADNEDESTVSYVDSVVWTALRAYTERPVWQPQTLGNVVLMAMCIRASNQLSGNIGKINMLVEGVYPTYVGSGSGNAQWVSGITQNIAAAMLWLIRGPYNPRPLVDAARFDWPALEAWALNCDSEGLKANAVITSTSTAKALLVDLCATGRAALTYKDGLISVAEDRAKASCKQLITPRNSWGFSWTKSFTEVPHGIKYTYIDSASDYVEDERVVLDDGYVYDIDNTGVTVNAFGEVYSVGSTDTTNNPGVVYVLATKFENVTLTFAKTATEVFKQGRYTLAVKRLRNTTYSVNMDWEQLACTRGDKVGVTHDAVSWGLDSAKITATVLNGYGDIESIMFDEPVTFTVGVTYGLRYRTVTGIYNTTFTVGTTGTYTSITPTAPIPAEYLVKADTLIYFGIAAISYSDLIIVGIEQGNDYSAKLTLVEYNPAIQAADQGTIPAHDAKVTKSPFSAVIAGVVANSENIAQSTDAGSLTASEIIQGTYDYVNNVGPSNNVTDLHITPKENADGTIDVTLDWNYIPGYIKASGFLVYAKTDTDAPDPINMETDTPIYVSISNVQ